MSFSDTSKSSGFRFKQFSVEHDQCAMKVGTDSIILGAWTQVGEATEILDIGTGSGLLALMLAQKQPKARFSAVEVEPAAARQARNNVKKSNFAHQIKVIETDIKRFYPSHKYMLIISNPPYFRGVHKRQHNLIDPNQARVYARSQQHLSHKQLIEQVDRLLAVDGTFYCVIPHSELTDMLELAEAHQLYVKARLDVSSNDMTTTIRCCLCLTRTKQALHHEVLIIHDDAGQYTEQYRELCRAYYLNF
jgi:tRNA1Val (adenine37-N6)-methyltransferase